MTPVRCLAVALVAAQLVAACAASPTVTERSGEPASAPASAGESQIATEAEVTAGEEPGGRAMTAEERSETELFRFGFDFAAAMVAERAPEPVDPLELGEPVAVEIDGLDAWAFETADVTTVVVLPGATPSEPEAFGLLLDQESTISYQALLTSFVLLDEQDAMVDVAAHFGLRAGRPRAFDGVRHSASIREPRGLEGEDAFWILTLVPDAADITHDAMFEATMTIVPLEVLDPPPAARQRGLDSIVLNDHHLPIEHGELRFGMTLDAFTAMSGIDASPAESDNRTYVTDRLDDLGADVTYVFYAPDHVLYQVILEYRAPESQVVDLAFRTFGAPPHDMPDMCSLATRLLSCGRKNGEWLLSTPDHHDVWANTFESTIVINSTMPNTEFGFPATAD